MLTKPVTIKTPFAAIIETLSESDLINGYFGGSNLLSHYLNDYSGEGANRFVAEWIEEHRPDSYAIENILDNPDWLIQEAAYQFHDGLALLLGRGDAETTLRLAKKKFDTYGQFYVYGTSHGEITYIIRAANESEAYEWLIDKFAKDFAVDEEDITEDTQMNDSGDYVNTEDLVFIGQIIFTK